MRKSFKIKTKLLLIYFICVLFPLFITNAAVILIAVQSSRQEQLVQFSGTTQRLSAEFNSAVDSCVAAANNLADDIQLSHYLNRHYEDAIAYYDAFYKFTKSNIINHYYDSQYIRNIEIYTENSSIVNGSYFLKLDSYRQSSWYQQYAGSSAKHLLLVYYDDSLSPARTARNICLVSQIDQNNFLKIDLDYTGLFRSVVGESENKRVLVEYNDLILFDSQENTTQLSDLYKTTAQNNLPQDAYFTTFPLSSARWGLYLIPHSTGFISQLGSYRALLASLFLFNLLLPTLAIGMVNYSFVSRITLVEEHLQKRDGQQFKPIQCSAGQDEIGNLITTYNAMCDHIDTLIHEIVKKNTEHHALQLSKKQAELNALQSQVNPHFLSNVLESIRMRSLIKGEEETADIMEAVSALMRRSIQWDKDFITIEEECHYVDRYLKVQQYRFGDRLDYIVHVFPHCNEMRIPKFSILSFVENACIHGIEQITTSGFISVLVKQEQEHLHIIITDTGAGMEADTLASIRSKLHNAGPQDLESSSHIGILNTYLRLGFYYEHHFGMEIESQKSIGTEIYLTLPIDYSPGPNDL